MSSMHIQKTPLASSPNPSFGLISNGTPCHLSEFSLQSPVQLRKPQQLRTSTSLQKYTKGWCNFETVLIHDLLKAYSMIIIFFSSQAVEKCKRALPFLKDSESRGRTQVIYCSCMLYSKSDSPEACCIYPKTHK